MPAGEPIETEDQEPAVEAVSRRDVLRRGVGFAIAAPALLTLLQACGDDDDDEEEEEETTTAPPAEETEPAAEETEPAVETPAAAGTPVDIGATTGGGAAPTSEPLPEPPGSS